MSLEKSIIVNPRICKLEYIFPEDVNKFNEYPGLSVSISLINGKSWQHLYSTSGKVVFSENPEPNDAGLLHQVKIQSYYPGLPDEVARVELEKIINQPAIFKLTFDTVIITIGSVDNPAQILSNLESNDSTGYVLTISWVSDKPVLFNLTALGWMD